MTDNLQLTIYNIALYLSAYAKKHPEAMTNPEFKAAYDMAHEVRTPDQISTWVQRVNDLEWRRGR